MYAFTATKHHRLLDLGPHWVRQVRNDISPDLTLRLSRLSEQDLDSLLTLGHLLAWRAPAGADTPAYLAWCQSLSSGDLYEAVAAAYVSGHAIPANLAELRDTLVDLLTAWNAEYFLRLNVSLHAGLASEAAALRARLPAADPQALVEEVSSGVVLLPSAEVSTVILVPQHHLRPWTLISPYKGTTFVLFPRETAEAHPGEAPPKLVRAVKALGDAGRLRMLRFLEGKERSFSEIVTELGLANATVNYHLGMLRAAGLVRVLSDVTGRGPMRYTLRSSALSSVLQDTAEYVGPNTRED